MQGEFGFVEDEVVIQALLHLIQGFLPLGATLDAEMLVQQRSMQTFDKPVALRPVYLVRAVLFSSWRNRSCMRAD